jgi:transcriptional regulator with XRE-family HTH domain
MPRRFSGLRKWMRANRVNQTRMAIYLGKSRSQVCRIFKGTQEFTIEDVYQLYLWTGLDIYELDITGSAQKLIKVYGERLRSGAESVR